VSNLEENDKKIKELFHEDKFISKKADDLFNNFLKEESNMNKEHEPKVRKMSIWKRALATAACFVVLLGGANIYASTKGYGNVFFLIKYLVTGEKVEIVDKNELLSDRDIVISYEPIQLTENIRIQVRRLQIKDNKAVLSVVVKEDGEANNIVPLKYVVNNSKGDIICEQTSQREIMTIDNEYCDELQLSSLYESDSKIALSIYNNASQQLVKLIIDINNKTITVEGAEEAISKISEVDLKKFLDIVSTYQHITKEDDDLDEKAKKFDMDSRIILASTFLDKSDRNAIPAKSYSAKIDSNTEGNKVEVINQVLKELGYRPIEDNYNGNKFKKVSYQGDEYFAYNQIDLDTNTCIEITNLTYAAGIYKAEYTYTGIAERDTFNVSIGESDINSATIFFKVNENNEYSKYTITQFNTSNPEFDELESFYQDVIVDEENNTNNQTNTTNTTVVNNTTSTNTTNNSNNTNNKPTDNSKVDNYASSLIWSEYNAPGLKIQYPVIMNTQIIETIYKGSDVTPADAKSVEFEGDLIGKNVDTQKVIKSHTKISVYLPEYVPQTTEIDYYAHAKELILNEPVDFSVIPGGPAGLTSKNGDNWSVSSITRDGKYYELYTCYQADIGFGYKVLFETDNIDNYKVRNVINWFLGNLKFTSF